MITIEMLIAQFPGLRRADLERWIVHGWVRAEYDEGQHLFHEIDVARVQLILELRDELQVNEETMPVVLSLLDQLYGLRRRVRELSDAVAETITDDGLVKLAAALRAAR